MKSNWQSCSKLGMCLIKWGLYWPKLHQQLNPLFSICVEPQLCCQRRQEHLHIPPCPAPCIAWAGSLPPTSSFQRRHTPREPVKGRQHKTSALRINTHMYIPQVLLIFFFFLGQGSTMSSLELFFLLSEVLFIGIAYFIGGRHGNSDLHNAIYHSIQILCRKLQKPWRCIFSATATT